MSRNSLLAILVVFLLVLPLPVSARTSGVSPGDSATFRYTIFTTYTAPNGNITTTQHDQFVVNVTKVDTSAELGVVYYTELVTLFNNQTVPTATKAYNETTIFDPYDNNTYLGNIGFLPFVYTDVAAGSTGNLSVSLSLLGTPNGDITGEQSVNASVSRSTSIISVDFDIYPGQSLPRSVTHLSYNATTGVLTHGVTYTNFFGVEKNFIYDLVSFSPAKTGGGVSTNWVIGGVAVALAVGLAIAVLRRPSREERKASRIRRRLARATPLLRRNRE